MLTALAVTGCTTADAADPPDPPEAATSTAPDPDPGPAPDTTDVPEPAAEPPGEDELAATWAAFHDTWTDQAAADQPDPDAFTDLALDPDTITAELEQHRAGTRLVTLDRELWTETDLHDDHAAITDCVIAEQHPADQPDSIATVTLGWEATAAFTDDGWRIETARPTRPFCIAEELNDQVLAAYDDWLTAHAEWYDPPDPEHPKLEATMADPGLADMTRILDEDRKAGIELRFPHEPQAVVTEVDAGNVRVTDCHEAVEGYGAFEVATGERRSDVIPPPEPGQRNRIVADLERRLERWLIVGWRWEEQNDCKPGETRYVTS